METCCERIRHVNCGIDLEKRKQPMDSLFFDLSTQDDYNGPPPNKRPRNSPLFQSFELDPSDPLPLTWTPTSDLNNQHNIQIRHHQNSFEPITAGNYTWTAWPDSFSRKQHFIQGKMHGARSRNSLVYGSKNENVFRSTRSLPTPGKRNLNDLLPGGLCYGVDDNKVGKKGLSRSCNPFFIEEKTSAEARKREAEAKSKDEDLTKFLERRAIDEAQAADQKQRDLQMLKDYRPWGKPGGGAPRALIDDSCVMAGRTRRINELIEDRDPLHLTGPGGGSPNRTDSGKLKAALKRDNEIAMQLREGGGLPLNMNIKRNTQNTKFLTDLEKQAIASRGPSISDQKENIFFPFGRPGGGAPRTDYSGNVITTRLDFDHIIQTEGEPTHQSKTNNISNTRGSHVEPEPIGLRFGRPGAGAPNRTTSGSVSTNLGQSLVKQGAGPLVKDTQEGDFFFKSKRGGAGEPIRDQDGKIVTQISNRIRYDHQGNTIFAEAEMRAKKDYLDTLEKMSSEQKHAKLIEKEAMREPSGEVASWLRQGLVGRPNYHPITGCIVGNPLRTSDVTKQKFEIRQIKNENSKQYHDELQRLALTKQQNRDQESKDTRQRSLQHVETSNQLWGRPGHGAPIQSTKKERSSDLFSNEAGYIYR